MAVHAKRKVHGVGKLEHAVCASDLLKSDHPLNAAFTAWLSGKPATKRQARVFLQVFPQYREVKSAS